MIIKALPLGDFAVNCYIVASETTKEGMLIDPGAEAKTILDQVRKLGLTISLIVNTHAHLDHTMELGAVKEALGARFALHAADVPILENVPATTLLWMGRRIPDVPAPEIVLQDGDAIDVGDLHFTVIHTPGHSPGSICLHTDGIVFSGDTLFFYGIGRTDLPGGSYEQLMESIATRLLVLPDDTIVYPGHGPDTTIGQEKQGNPFLQGYQAD